MEVAHHLKTISVVSSVTTSYCVKTPYLLTGVETYPLISMVQSALLQWTGRTLKRSIVF